MRREKSWTGIRAKLFFVSATEAELRLFGGRRFALY